MRFKNESKYQKREILTYFKWVKQTYSIFLSLFFYIFLQDKSLKNRK